MIITLRFDEHGNELLLTGRLFDSPAGRELYQSLPQEIHLKKWGNELYGAIRSELPPGHLQTEIPEGGIAYTNQGNYLCIFYGQRPAWPVNYIGQILGDSWKELLEKNPEYLFLQSR